MFSTQRVRYDAHPRAYALALTRDLLEPERAYPLGDLLERVGRRIERPVRMRGVVAVEAAARSLSSVSIDSLPIPPAPVTITPIGKPDRRFTILSAYRYTMPLANKGVPAQAQGSDPCRCEERDSHHDRLATHAGAECSGSDTVDLLAMLLEYHCEVGLSSDMTVQLSQGFRGHQELMRLAVVGNALELEPFLRRLGCLEDSNFLSNRMRVSPSMCFVHDLSTEDY